MCLLFWYILCVCMVISDDCGANIRPGPSGTIYCLNTCSQCIINCNTEDQCKDGNLNIISGAIDTQINCNANDACHTINVYIGDIGSMNIDLSGSGYDGTDFYRNDYKASISCTGSTSCKLSYFEIKGSFPDGIILNADGGNNNNNNMGESDLIVTLEAEQTFELYCSNEDKNCDQLNFDCFGGICTCDDGGSNVCRGLDGNGVNISTFNPTKSTNVPTDLPSQNPTITPTKNSQNPTKLTLNPTALTQTPTKSTNIPTTITSFPTKSDPTTSPTKAPSNTPTIYPTLNPTISPTMSPTETPSKGTINPTNAPSLMTTNIPTISTQIPTNYPTITPSVAPTNFPTMNTVPPTLSPIIAPTKSTKIPSNFPTHTPTSIPTEAPTIFNDVQGRTPKASQPVSTELILIVIFCVVGIVILLLIALFCILRRKRKNNAGKLQDRFNQVGSRSNVLDNSPSFHGIASIDEGNNNNANEHITAGGPLNPIEGNVTTGDNGDNDLIMDIINEDNNNVTPGGPINDTDAEYISEMLGENDINTEIKNSKQEVHLANNSLFGHELQNNKLVEDVLMDDMVNEMDQENADNKLAKQMTNVPETVGGDAETPGNNEHVTPGGDVNGDDAEYIAQMLDEQEIQERMDSNNNNNNNLDNIDKQFGNGLKDGKSVENAVMDDMFQEMNQEQNDKKLAKTLTNNITPGN